jgi:hypothetical protein
VEHDSPGDPDRSDTVEYIGDLDARDVEHDSPADPDRSDNGGYIGNLDVGGLDLKLRAPSVRSLNRLAN